MTQKQGYWELLQRLGEMKAGDLNQTQKGAMLGISQPMVSFLDRIRERIDGGDASELEDLIRSGKLPADALKYLPMSDTEAEADWAKSMAAATGDERKALLKELKAQVAGVRVPSDKDLRSNVHRIMRENSPDSFEHAVGLVSGIGYMQGLYGFDSAMDPTGRSQLNACQKLCSGRKPGQYHWIRNFFGSVASGSKD